MNIQKLSKIQDLLDIPESSGIYIYGAKTIAQRCCKYLCFHNRTVAGFLVSEKYENPESLCGHPVFRIEEHANRLFDTVILAVSTRFILPVLDFLNSYSISIVYVIPMTLADAFPFREIAGSSCRVSERTLIEDGVEIYADDSSEIEVADYCVLSPGTLIFATNHSSIRIGRGTSLGREMVINADCNATVEIGQRCNIGRNSSIQAANGGVVSFDENCSIGEHAAVCVEDDTSEIDLKQNICIGGMAIINAHTNGNISVGEDTTINNFLYMSAIGSSISIGPDNMFSFHLKIQAGGHNIADQVTKESCLNRKPIITGKHVWIGMGAALLSGSNIGEGSVVGAQAVANKIYPPHCTLAGNPARVLHEGIEWNREHMESQDQSVLYTGALHV